MRKLRGGTIPLALCLSFLVTFLLSVNQIDVVLSRMYEAKPKYMVVAVHSRISVFPRLLKQVSPQVTKEWTVRFVAAINSTSPPPNWNQVIISPEYKALLPVVHSITFAHIVTNAQYHDIANVFAYNHSFWNATPPSIEYFWFIQDDSAVCSTNTEWCIQDFLEWDYLGAEWGDYTTVNKMSYGNGGFSLRSRRLQIECSHPSYGKSVKKVRLRAEDEYFSYCLRDPQMRFRVAPLEVARHFSSERPLYIGSFGWHAQSRGRKCNETMIRYCPEALEPYEKWHCQVPLYLTPVNSTPKCRGRPPKSALSSAQRTKAKVV